MTTSRRSKPTNAASPASARLRTAGARITLPDEVAPGLATGLGGLGITLRDLAALYAGLARGGDVPALTETARDNAIAQHFGRGPWIAGGHLDRRRRHLGIMRDRQREIGDGADDRDEQEDGEEQEGPIRNARSGPTQAGYRLTPALPRRGRGSAARNRQRKRFRLSVQNCATNHGYRSRSQEPFPGVSFERRGAPFVSGLQAS